MKKLFLAVLLLIGSSIVTKAHQESIIKVELRVQNDKPITNGIPVPKSPVIPPDVYLDDHTLYIGCIVDDFTIQLIDDTNAVVYSAFVLNGTTTIVLPSTLTGEYELSIIPNNGIYYFNGDITL